MYVAGRGSCEQRPAICDSRSGGRGFENRSSQLNIWHNVSTSQGFLVLNFGPEQERHNMLVLQLLVERGSPCERRQH